MKIKINYYLVGLIKENLVYLAVFIFMTIAFLISTIVLLNRLRTNTEKISANAVEIADLKKKVELVNYKQEILQEGIDLEKVNQVLSQLIPNEEDFFSVIYSLEEISKKTNFVITRYTINLQGTTINKLALTVEGEGDNQSFFKFLEEYRYIGGRLITIDKIDYGTAVLTTVKLNINFYSGKEQPVQTTTTAKLSREDKKLVKEILSKVSIELKSEVKVTPYPIKDSPF